MSDREQIKEHLAFASELGVAGVSRDPAWRAREDRAPAREDAGRVRESAGPEGESVGRRVSGTETPASQGRPHDAAAAATSSQTGEAVVLVRSAAEVLATIKADIGPACMRCKLHRLGRTQVVFGVGNPEARLMFVGEAPGADEDEQGIPFVGRAGQLLTKIIEAIGLTREDVYIANVIKCRPPQNRNPETDEVETCEPFLFQQIDAIRPAVIVALGKFGAQTLLRTVEPISRLRGRVFDFRGAKLMPTFHPAYLLRNPSSKRDVWEDMKEVRRLLQQAP